VDEEQQPVNPYIAGAPVSGADMFYGRDDVFAFIKRNLIGKHRDSAIVLYGQRRTGKTSVLYQLDRRLGPGYRCVFIDLHGLGLGSMGDFLFGIASLVSRGLRRDHGIDVALPDRSVFLADPRSAFEEVFLNEALTALGADHLVLMLDEAIRLDDEVRAGRMEREVFDYLRHLMQHYPRLNFILSLGSGLEEMRKDYALMLNTSLYHRISFLEPTAASALVTEPVHDHFVVTPDAVDKILQITSGHPYYTQLVCHCLFDRWSRTPTPEMTVADVYAVLAEAIELGSANLTYVWEDSTPEERVVMAGMAAAMRGGHRAVTTGQVRDAWRRSGVVLPDRQAAAALRSLASREVTSGESAYSFAVDLQRLWLDKHRRLDWVKDELAEPIRQWDREARATRRNRYVAAMAAVVLIAGYVAAGAIAGLPPFPRHTTVLSPTQVLLDAMPGDLSSHPGECHSTAPPRPWRTAGMDAALRCTDPGLAGGEVDGYHFGTTASLGLSFISFNKWWGFSARVATTLCPPTGNGFGWLDYGGVQIECGLSPGSASSATWVEFFPTSNSFVVARTAPGDDSFAQLKSWMTTPTPSPVSATGEAAPTSGTLKLAAGVKPLKVLLPTDIQDAGTECAHQAKIPWNSPGLVTALVCAAPDIPNGQVFAYQMDSAADYNRAWASYNTWSNFGTSSALTCPPSAGGTQGGPGVWFGPRFAARAGQVLECFTSNSGPVYVWTYPTEDAFIVAQPPKSWTFSKLETWWENNSV
jgi:hypothetical protein